MKPAFSNMCKFEIDGNSRSGRSCWNDWKSIRGLIYCPTNILQIPNKQVIRLIKKRAQNMVWLHFVFIKIRRKLTVLNDFRLMAPKYWMEYINVQLAVNAWWEIQFSNMKWPPSGHMLHMSNILAGSFWIRKLIFRIPFVVAIANSLDIYLTDDW